MRRVKFDDRFPGNDDGFRGCGSSVSCRSAIALTALSTCLSKSSSEIVRLVRSIVSMNCMAAVFS